MRQKCVTIPYSGCGLNSLSDERKDGTQVFGIY